MESTDMTSLCYKNIAKHDIVKATCLTCIKYRALEEIENQEAFRPAYPLRSTCIRGLKICHTIGCTACAWRREITPCTKTLTSLWDEKQAESLLREHYCLHCDEKHVLKKSDLTLECTRKRIICERRLDCQIGGIHNVCYFHQSKLRCCECKKLRFEGQVNSTSNGNHTTSTSAGGNVNIINYYGENYTQTYNPNQMAISPESIGGAVSGVTSAVMPFINSPTVESMAGDVSDRLIQMVSGNSAIISQEAAAGAVCAYGQVPTYLTPQNNTVDLSTRPGPACDRFYTLDSFLLQEDKAEIIPIPGILSDIGVFGTNLQFHYLWRAGFVFHVMFNATAFSAGAFIVAVVPECEFYDVTSDPETSDKAWYEATSFFKRATLQIEKGCLVNNIDNHTQSQDSSSKRYKTLPVGQLTVFPHQIVNIRTNNSATIVMPYSNFVPSSCFTTHNIYRLVICPLTPLPTSDAQKLPCTVTVMPVCSQFNGLHNLAQAQGLPVVVQPGSDQLSSVAPSMGIPTYMNWNSETILPNPGEFSNFMSVARLPTILCTKGTSADVEFGFEVQNQDITDGPIFQMDVSSLDGALEQTYLGRLGTMFAQYKGSIVITLTYTGPKLSSGKLLISYTPPGTSQPTSRLEAMQGTHLIWDFGLQSSVNFTIPYISVSQRRYGQLRGNMMSYDGWFMVFYQTAVVMPPNSVTKATVLVSVSAGEDMEMHIFSDTARMQGDAVATMISDAVHQQVQQQLNTLPSVNQQLTTSDSQGIVQGAAPATTAIETGASAVVSPSTTMQTEGVLTGSCAETSINTMLSRYWLYCDTRLYISSNSNAETGARACARTSVKLDLFNLSDIVSGKGNTTLTTILNMATYWRYDLDVAIKLVSQENVCYQVMFAPVGSYNDDSSDSNGVSWRGANPHFTSNAHSPPICFRIPYNSPASCFTSCFDGFPNFDTGAKAIKDAVRQYGQVSSNVFGNLLIRAFVGWQTGTVTTDTGKNYRLLVFVKPVNVRAWMPRPLTLTKSWMARPPAITRTVVLQGPEEEPFSVYPQYCEGPEYYGTWEDGEFFSLHNVFFNDDHCGNWSPFVRSFYSPVESESDKHVVACVLGYANRMAFINPDLTEPVRRWIERDKLMLVLGNEHLTRLWIDMRNTLHRRYVEDDEGYFSDVYFEGPSEMIKSFATSVLKDSLGEVIEDVEKKYAVSRANWWKKIVALVTKFVSVITLISRSNGDPVILASIGAMISIDLMVECPFDWLKGQIVELLGLPSPQGGAKTVRDITAIVNMFKSFDWIIGKIMELINWLKEKISPRLDQLEKEADTISQLHDRIVEWRKYQINPNLYDSESVNKLANSILEAREILERNDPNSVILRTSQNVFFSVSKHLTQTKGRRCEPVAVLIHGSPGEGKSLATSILGKSLAKFFGKSEPYSLPPDPKHFDGYNQQDVVIMDDIGQNPDGEDMKLICQMISSTDFHPPMADLEDKGRKFTSRIVLASTNLNNLNPVTVACPQALKRRFVFDLDIKVFPTYMKNGMLDVEKALQPCDHESVTFSSCCPFVCGKAVCFHDRTTGEKFSLDVLNIKIRSLEKKKNTIADLLNPLFQGPILRPVVKQGKKLPKEIRDLIEQEREFGGVKRPMLQYAVDMGYEIPEDLADGVLLSETKVVSTNWKNIALIGATVIALFTTMYFIWKSIPKSVEGPYSGSVVQPLRRPEPRVVKVEGNVDPDTEFAVSLMRHNLFPITTGTGDYTAIGLYGKKVVLPHHAAVGPFVIGGKEMEPSSIETLVNSGKHLEMCVLEFPDLNDFKDIRKYLVNTIEPTGDCILALNSLKFPRMVVPLRRVYPRGTMNMQGVIVGNTLMYSAQTRPGYCGGLILKAGKILGFHIAGDGAQGYAAWMKKSYFDPGLQGVMRDLEEKPPRPVNVNRKSRFEPSIYHHKIDVKKEPAVLSMFDKRCEVDFEKNLFIKYKGNCNLKYEDVPELKEAVVQYSSQLAQIMPHDVKEPLTLDQAIEGYGRMEALDLATSAGYPYCTMGISKRKLMDNNKSELIKGLDLFGYNLPLVTCLKDELRPIEKVKQGNTRLIEASSINDSVRMRQVFGRMFEAMIANPGTITGSAVGCNPDVDWTKFATEMGENVFAFDYKNFDASLSPLWFEALEDVIKRLGIDSLDLIKNICYSKHIYGNRLYCVDGGMPSGTSGTSIFNTMINNLILKTLALRAYKGLDLEQLKILAYGDDCLISYPFPLDPSLFANVAKSFGLTITPADKGKDFGEPGSIEKVTFLKRGFMPDLKYQFLYHPVFDEDEIYQSLAWTKDPRTLPEHVRSLCHLLWHSGEQKYEKFKNFIQSEPIGRVLYIPPFESLYRMWLEQF